LLIFLTSQRLWVFEAQLPALAPSRPSASRVALPSRALRLTEITSLSVARSPERQRQEFLVDVISFG
jgi:hypothetical protein